MTDIVKVNVTPDGKTAWARFDGATNRVVSTTAEGDCVTRLTSGRTPELAQLYADFQNTSNKVSWLTENQGILKIYDINVGSLVEKYTNA